MEKFKRAFFRLEFDNLSTNIEIISEKNKLLEPPKRYNVKTKDMSGGGLSFTSRENLHVDSNKPVVSKIFFTLNEQKFGFETSILRQEKVGQEYLYGCKFENVSKKERSRLTTILLKMDLINRKDRVEKMISNRLKRKKM